MKDSEWGFNDKAPKQRKGAEGSASTQEPKVASPRREVAAKIEEAKRTRPVKTPRVKVPRQIRERKTDSEPGPRFTKTFTLIAAGVILTVGSGGAGYLVGMGNSANVAAKSIISNDALTADNMASLPAGITGQELLDGKTAEQAGKQSDDILTEMTGSLGSEFGVEFKKVSDSQSVPLQTDKSAGSLAYQVNSESFSSNGPILTPEQRTKAIELVNAVVTKHNFAPFDINSLSTGQYADEAARVAAFGNSDPLLGQFLIIAGDGIENQRLRYVVGISNTQIPDGETSTTKEGTVITMTFMSYPHLKAGTQDKFKSLIASEFEAGKFTDPSK